MPSLSNRLWPCSGSSGAAVYMSCPTDPAPVVPVLEQLSICPVRQASPCCAGSETAVLCLYVLSDGPCSCCAGSRAAVYVSCPTDPSLLCRFSSSCQYVLSDRSRPCHASSGAAVYMSCPTDPVPAVPVLKQLSICPVRQTLSLLCRF